MCGIAGIIGSTDCPGKSYLLQSQSLRGPDSSGVWETDNVCLGHNRLAIIDLSDTGLQPRLSLNGKFVIVFNGEIYNYKELAVKYNLSAAESENDTCVLIELYSKYGSGILNELTGMFAFAIYHIEEQKLFICRDRFGVKPFYYYHSLGQFMFGSEIKQLWKLGVEKSPNVESWSSYFIHGTFAAPGTTFWNGVYQLPAGYAGTYTREENSLSIYKWYNFQDAVLPRMEANTDDTSLMEEYEELLYKSIQYRFISDVPVGIAVSGGLDSSALIGIINNSKRDTALNAFNFYTNHTDYSELPWVKELLAETNISLHPVLLEPFEIPSLTTKISAYQDEPFGGIPTLAYAKLFANAAEKGIKVLLDGQGIDEALAGYDYYHREDQSLIQGGESLGNLDILQQDFAEKAINPAFEKPFSNRMLNKQYRDLFFTKLPRALRFNDRASMMSSVELREPFLDHHLVEAGFSLPLHLKYQEGQTKYILRQLTAKLIQRKVALAPKRPVQTPQREWLANDLADWASACIHFVAETGNPGWFNKKNTLEAFEQYKKSKPNNSNHIWQLINTAYLLGFK